MEIFRALRTSAVSYVSDKFVDNPDYSTEQTAEFVVDMMERDPKSIFFLIAYEGDLATEENPRDGVVGFAIATAPAGLNHTCLYQIWVDGINGGKEVSDALHRKVILWTNAMDRGEIRLETTLEPSEIVDRWGYNLYSKVFSFAIPSNLEEIMLNRVNLLSGIKKNKYPSNPNFE